MKSVFTLGALLGIGIIPLIGGIIGLLVGLNNENGNVIFYSLLIIAPFPLCLYLFFKARDQGRAEFEALAQKDGPVDRLHWCETTGVAINVGKREITLCRSGVSKKYSFSQVRSWEDKMMYGGVALGNSTQAAIYNGASMIRNSMNTGFEVCVKDLDHPVWMIQMPKKRDRAIWFETFEQALNEGGLHSSR